MKNSLFTKSFLLPLCLLLFSAGILSAATITVTTTADSGPGSLRDAVASSINGDQIIFDSALNGSPHNLVSEIVINTAITITGNGTANTILQSSSSRMFNITTSPVSISGIFFQSGFSVDNGGAIFMNAVTVDITDCFFNGNTAAGGLATQGGGAIFNDGGTLTILNSDFNDNAASTGSGSGGAIFNGPGGTLTITGGSMTFNAAQRAGGAIEDNSGAGTTVNLTNVTMDTNLALTSPGNGGAIHISGAGNININGGTAANNYADNEGGGFWNGTGTMNIVGTTIVTNTAAGPLSDDGGGGIFNAGGIVNIRDANISDNLATGAAGSGGAILNNVGGTLNVFRTTMNNNTSVRAGGAIEDNSGAGGGLKLNQVTVNNNTTSNTPGNGGGLHITGAGNSTIENSTFDSNVASAEGGGIWNGSGSMLIENTNIGLNQASGDLSDQGGGGVFNAGGTLKIRGGTITGNAADGLLGSGGGILNDAGGTLTILGGTVSGNTAIRAGGGIEDNSGIGTLVQLSGVNLDGNSAASSPGNGGGLHVTGDGNVNLRGGTVNNNNASLEGGGLWNGTGTMNVVATSINGNIAFGDGPDEGGGGIFNAGGILNVRDVTISANGAVGLAGSGGGILNDNLGMLRVFRSSVTNNVATRAGGGVEDNSGNSTTIRFNQATISTNTTGSSPGNGGGIHITGNGNSYIENSNINANGATAEGGGIWNGTGSMLIQSTNILSNIAAGAAADQGGGGVFNAGGTIKIRSGSVSRNQATGTAGSGGGILNDAGGTLTVLGTIVEDNVAQRAGGGIEDNSGAGGNVSLRDVNLNKNDAGTNPGNGGGLHITGAGNSDIRAGTVSNNTAALEGGGIWNGSGTMKIVLTNISRNTASGNAADEGGGGIFNAGGTVRIRDASVNFNEAVGTSASGGGIFNDTGGTLTVFRSSIIGNDAARAGGGIEDNSGAGSTLKLNRVNMNENSAGWLSANGNPGNGGAVHISGNGNSDILNSEIFGNNAANNGGGLWNGTGTMTITTSLIHFNRSFVVSLGAGGGGLWNQGGTVNVNTSTFSGNEAITAAGGGLVNLNGSVNIVSSTFAGNRAALVGGMTQSSGGTITLANTIVALNDGTNPGANGDDVGGAGILVSNDYNFIGRDDTAGIAAGAAQPNDQVGTLGAPINPNLDPLQNNGGFTRTHAIICILPSGAVNPIVNGGNPAINTDDQRGLGVFNGTRDIGAFELQSACPEPIIDNNGNQHLVDLNTTESFQSSVYPNPVVNGRASVQIPETFGENVMIRVMDMRGTLIMEQQAYVGTEEMDFARLPKGTYTVQVISPNVTESHRIIIAQ